MQAGPWYFRFERTPASEYDIARYNHVSTGLLPDDLDLDYAEAAIIASGTLGSAK